METFANSQSRGRLSFLTLWGGGVSLPHRCCFRAARRARGSVRHHREVPCLAAPTTSSSPQRLCGSASTLRPGSGLGCRGTSRRRGSAARCSPRPAPGGRRGSACPDCHLAARRRRPPGAARSLRVLLPVCSSHNASAFCSARGFRRKARGDGGRWPYLDVAPLLLWTCLIAPAACNGASATSPAGLGLKLYLLCFFSLIDHVF